MLAEAHASTSEGKFSVINKFKTANNPSAAVYESLLQLAGEKEISRAISFAGGARHPL